MSNRLVEGGDARQSPLEDRTDRTDIYDKMFTTLAYMVCAG